MGISAGGLVSGLDTDALIESLVSLEKRPIAQLQSQQAAFESKISAYGSLKGALSGLKTSVAGLTDTDNFSEGFKASSSNQDLVTVDTGDAADSGTYSLIVSQLATSEQMSGNTYSAATDTVGQGTLQFKLENGDKYDIAIDADNDTLAGVATAINDASADVSASVLKVSDSDYRLTISAKDTGQTINYSLQESGFTFTTAVQTSDSVGETIASEDFDSQDTALGISGTLTVNGTDIAMDGTETLQDLQSSVGALADISATIEYNDTTGKYSLEIANDVAGQSVDLDYQDSDTTGGLSELMDETATQAAKKALINFNGIDIERDTNSISDLIDGLTVNLKDADITKTVSVSVTGNYSSASEKIGGFVKKYNATIGTLNQLQKYGGEDGPSGTLLGDSTARLLQSGIQNKIANDYGDTNSSVNRLNDIGIAVNADGTLSFNAGTFTEAMDENTSDVLDFFTDDNAGFAVQLETYLEGYTQNDGILDAKDDGYNTSIERLQDKQTQIEARVDKKEEMLRQQFSSLEQLLSGYQSTQTFLTAQLSSMFSSNS